MILRSYRINSASIAGMQLKEVDGFFSVELIGQSGPLAVKRFKTEADARKMMKSVEKGEWVEVYSG